MSYTEKGQLIRLATPINKQHFASIAALDGYWEAVRGGRPMPMRADVDPRGIESALKDAFILERVAPGVARFRLAGAHLGDLLGMDPRGMPLTCLMRPEGRVSLSDIIEDVVTRPAVATLALAVETGIGRPRLAARMWLAPLGSDDGPGTRLLGGLETHGEIGRTPRRFGISEIAMREIEATDYTGPASFRAPARQARTSKDTGGYAAGKAPDPAPQRRDGPHLRLVKRV